MSRKNQQPIPSMRGARSKKEKVSSLWNDLAELHTRCLDMSQTPGEVTFILRNRTLTDAIGNTSELENLGRMLVRDIREFRERLQRIFTRHENRHGECKTPDELMETISIHEEYLEWIESFQNTVLPIVSQILDIGKRAQAKLSQNIETSTTTQDSPAA